MRSIGKSRLALTGVATLGGLLMAQTPAVAQSMEQFYKSANMVITTLVLDMPCFSTSA